MITEDRLHHILGVARKAYKIALEYGYNETFAKKCFMLGWLHDVGYEFADADNHAIESANMFLLLNIDSDVNLDNNLDNNLIFNNLNKKSFNAIKYHGNFPDEMTDEYIILTIADMLVDSKGNEVTADLRLYDIKQRYGEDSKQYIIAHNICQILNLIILKI